MSSVKGILWSIIFLICTSIYLTIPTYLIFTYYATLATLTDAQGRPIYTYAIFFIFVWAISLMVMLIFVAATLRAIIQRKNEVDGIPRAVKGFGLVSFIVFALIFVLWYLLLGEIAFFSLTA
ncbi:MAG: hypothetical protein EU535_08710 [Promethearchaeota archaeon]|nr:MAG: hypothetical protein EU535_08710 [Candidatus Lokiarchaeota archaeon]